MKRDSDRVEAGAAPGATGREDRSFFPESVRSQRLNLLLHLAPYGGIFLVLGEEKMGKTTLLRQFVARSADSSRLCCLDADPGQDSSAFLRRVTQGFGVRSARDDDQALLTVLGEQLRAWKENALAPVLVIDDAHDLPDDVLFLLLKLLFNPRAEERLLSIVLFARPELERRLIQPDMRLFHARVTHSFDLPPFGDEDIRRYIHHRLEQDGAGTDLPASMMKFVQVASHGVPGQIDELLETVVQARRDGRPAGLEPVPEQLAAIRGQRAVADSDAAGEGPARPERVRRPRRLVLPAAAALALLVAGLLVYRSDPGRWLDSDPVTALLEQASQQETVSAERAAPVTVETEAPLRQADNQADNQAGNRGGNGPRVDSVPAGGRAGDGTVPVPATERDAADREASRLADSGPDAPVVTAAEDAQRALGEHDAAGSQPSAPEEVAPTAVATQAVPRQGGRADPPDAAALPATRVAAERVKNDETWIAARQGDQYTLQLLAMEPAEVEAFVKQHGLAERVHYYRTRSKQGELLAVTYGEFAARAEAEQAGQALQQRVAGIRPWTRQFAAVQSALAMAANERARQRRGGRLAQGEQWLLEQEPRRYTLQLLAMEEQAVEGFVQQHGLSARVRYFRTSSGSKALVAAAYGNYASKAEAEADARRLMEQVPGFIKPWARSFASIQSVIGTKPGGPAAAP